MLVGLALTALLGATRYVGAIPAFPITPDLAGGLESVTNTQTSLPSASAVSSPYNQDALDKLWAEVEKDIPVETPSISSVVPVNNSFAVPKTPTLPRSLQDHATSGRKFPKGFKFGVATADQQYEGAVKADGRGPSHWDYLCHRLPQQCNNYTSDITDLGRYYYKQDIARIKAMGVNTVSLTLSWSRIKPFGTADSPVSKEGLQFYDDFINELIDNGIEPVVTLFHWSTPLNLVFEYGAFLNGSSVEDFASYAKLVFEHFGDRVTTFLTFNEPRVYCSEYTGEPFNDYWHFGGPNINATTAPYPCTYNILKAHGRAVQEYRALVNSGKIKKGEVAIKNDDSYPVPVNPDSEADVEAAKRHFDFYIGIFSQPIYGDGKFPDTVRNTISTEFLPYLTDDEKAMIKGSGDFFAIDAYRTNLARAAPNGIQACVANISDPNWPVCQDNSPEGQYQTMDGFAFGPPADPNAAWLYDTSFKLRYQLKTLKEAFNYDKIYISEFGFARPYEYLYPYGFDVLYDTDRAIYYQDYMAEALDAIHDDGIPLAGVFAWSFVDNFEWASGLEQRFGMQFVNYTTLEREYKLSFLLYRDFIENHSCED
nr:beta-glycosidase [Sterigmatomyces elviae]